MAHLLMIFWGLSLCAITASGLMMLKTGPWSYRRSLFWIALNLFWMWTIIGLAVCR